MQKIDTVRNNSWLAALLTRLHAEYYPDVSIPNRIIVKFGRKAIRRFGSITSHNSPTHTAPVTTITINGLFTDEIVPEYVIAATLLHEFAHYTHGFHSPHPRKYQHPHRGNIVNKEIIKRGAGEILANQERWIKDEYPSFIKRNYLR